MQELADVQAAESYQKAVEALRNQYIDKLEVAYTESLDTVFSYLEEGAEGKISYQGLIILRNDEFGIWQSE